MGINGYEKLHHLIITFIVTAILSLLFSSFGFAQGENCDSIIVKEIGDIYAIETNPEEVIIRCDHEPYVLEAVCVEIIKPGFYQIGAGVGYSEGQGNESFYIRFQQPQGTFAQQFEANAGIFKVVPDTSFLPFLADRDAGKFYLETGFYTLVLNHYFLIQDEFPQFLNPPNEPMDGQCPESIHFYNFQFEYLGDSTRTFDLSLLKFAEQDSVYRNEQINYSLTVENQGPDAATEFSVVDTLPHLMTASNFNFPPDSMLNNLLFWKFAELNPGQQQTISYSGNLEQPFSDTLSVVVNSARVLSVDDLNPENNYDQARVYIKNDQPEPVIHYDLSLTKTGSTDTVETGETFLYYLIMENKGPGNAKSITLTDTIPEVINVIDFSQQPDSSFENILYWFFDSLNSNEEHSVELTAILEIPAPDTNFSFINSAEINAEQDTNESNNHSQYEIYVKGRNIQPELNYDLGISKSASQDTAKPNESFSYSIILENFGPAVARGITVFDSLPQCVQVNKFSTQPDSALNNELYWFVDSLFAGEKLTISLECSITPFFIDTTFLAINSVQVIAPKDTNDVNNYDSAELIYIEKTDSPVINFDLSLTKTVNKDTVAIGESIEYQLTVKNISQETAQNFTLIDTIPALLNSVQCSPAPDSTMSNLLFWFFDSLTYNDNQEISISAIIDSNLPEEFTPITNAAFVFAENDTNTNNNHAEVTVTALAENEPVEKYSDLFILKTANKDTVFQGDRISYGIRIANQGPDPARQITVLDTMPEFLTILGFSREPDSTYNNLLFWEIDSLGYGEEIEIAINTLFSFEFEDSIFIIENIAAVTALNDTNQTNNFSKVCTIAKNEFEEPGNDYELELTKTADRDTVEAGEEFNYEIIVKNLGPDIAYDITLMDSMPECIDATAFEPEPDSAVDKKYFWFFDSIGVNQEQTVIITAVYNCEFDSLLSVTNTVAVYSPEDSNYIGQKAKSKIIVIDNTDPNNNYELRLSKTTNKDTVEIGEQILYELTVENLGPGTAYHVTVRDSLPTELIVSNFNPEPDSTFENVLFWNYDSLAAGQIEIINYAASLNPALPDSNYSIVNVAFVSSDGDTNLIGEEARSRIIIIEENYPPDYSYNLELTKTTDRDTVAAGDTFNYELTIFNYGPNTAYNITLKDSLPEFIIVSDFNPEPDSVFQNVLFWFFDSLLAGEHVTVIFTAMVEATLPQSVMPIKNIAAVYAAGDTSSSDDEDETEIITKDGLILEDCDRSYYFDENVFEPETGKFLTITFSIKTTQSVRLDLYDISGYHVSTIAEDIFNKGENKYPWNGKAENGQNVGSGVYIIALRTQHLNCWKKVIIVR